MIGLAALFLLTALLYAAVGFGGGSTYSALLVLAKTDFHLVPVISLMCNLLVVSVGTWRFARAGQMPWRRAWPLFTLSVPLAWVGGRLAVSELLFVGLLAVSLLVAGLAMLWQRKPLPDDTTSAPTWREPIIGGMLGLLAGIIGIGGGIFLAPVLHLMRWGGAKAIAGTCALFILVNSIAGLAGQLAKPETMSRLETMGGYWLLFPAVAIGGLAGSVIGSTRLKPRHLAVLTAILVLYVAGQLAVRFVHMLSTAA
ncbi:sulfite exporter TauE/SafE family protein [Sphingomonas sp.]|uniref:sulfite exporter TauE/SafE family protein n=1 Tax=Sphingomonas sp. TaxID=28214 RepID=UPI00325FC473